jgi:hypothetical protein
VGKKEKSKSKSFGPRIIGIGGILEQGAALQILNVIHWVMLNFAP